MFDGKLTPVTLSLLATSGNLGTMNSTVLTHVALRRKVTGLNRLTSCSTLAYVSVVMVM